MSVHPERYRRLGPLVLLTEASNVTDKLLGAFTIIPLVAPYRALNPPRNNFAVCSCPRDNINLRSNTVANSQSTNNHFRNTWSLIG